LPFASRDNRRTKPVDAGSVGLAAVGLDGTRVTFARATAWPEAAHIVETKPIAALVAGGAALAAPEAGAQGPVPSHVVVVDSLPWQPKGRVGTVGRAHLRVDRRRPKLLSSRERGLIGERVAVEMGRA